ncbi:MAG: RnfABCDGE type electron transport complex subunit C, partial [Bacillota bacterium]
LQGIGYIQKALGAESVDIGIEDNKMPAIERMRSACTDKNTTIHQLKTKYPQGGEKQLIYAITKKKVPNGGLPSDLGYIVLNISTAFAVYEAVALGKPTIERYMTLSGGGMAVPCNIHVKIGIPFEEIVAVYGINKGYVKAVSGGPMMGISMSNLRAVSSKGSSALLLLNEDEIRAVEPSACINCGRCHKACPIGLMPMMTDALVLKGLIKEAKEYYPMSCIECGCCAFVCPAKRPLVQSQRLAKKLIRENKL